MFQTAGETGICHSKRTLNPKPKTKKTNLEQPPNYEASIRVQESKISLRIDFRAMIV